MGSFFNTPFPTLPIVVAAFFTLAQEGIAFLY